MSDKRLGSNPLSWVDPKPASPETTQTPGAEPKATASHASSHVPCGGIFTTTDPFTKEDRMSKSKIKIKKTMKTDEAITHLEDLAASMKSGTIRAEDGSESVVLTTGESVQFEMKISRKKDKAKCSLEIEWTDDGSKADDFKISK